MTAARACDLVVAGGRARFRGRVMSCRIGRGGIRVDKAEGDGATPAGVYSAMFVLYRPDRIGRPATRLDAMPLRRSDGWSDDPDDECYNQPVRRPHSHGCESMWLASGLYDLVAPLDYNFDPAKAGLGSAIFLHVADRLGRPTAGCVAFRKSDLLWMLRRWERRTRVIVKPGGMRSGRLSGRILQSAN